MSSRFTPARVGPWLVIAAVAIILHFIESPFEPEVWQNVSQVCARAHART